MRFLGLISLLGFFGSGLGFKLFFRFGLIFLGAGQIRAWAGRPVCKSWMNSNFNYANVKGKYTSSQCKLTNVNAN